TLTVGSPQFKYGTEADPLAENFLKANSIQLPSSGAYTYAWSPPKNNNIFSNQIISKEESADSAEPVSYNDYSNYSTEGEKSSDLYLYKIGVGSLPMNSKTSFPIFSVNVPYEDIYEVHIGDITNYSTYGQVYNNGTQSSDVL